MSFPCPLKREDVLRACGFDMNGVISTALISAFPGIHGELALCIVAGNLRKGDEATNGQGQRSFGVGSSIFF